MPVWAELPPEEAACGAELQAGARRPAWLRVLRQTTRLRSCLIASRARYIELRSSEVLRNVEAVVPAKHLTGTLTTFGSRHRLLSPCHLAKVPRSDPGHFFRHPPSGPCLLVYRPPLGFPVAAPFSSKSPDSFLGRVSVSHPFPH